MSIWNSMQQSAHNEWNVLDGGNGPFSPPKKEGGKKELSKVLLAVPREVSRWHMDCGLID
jgi:hypothetical protein